MKIFKYAVPLPGIDLDIPIGSKLLSLQVEGTTPTLSMLVDDKLPQEYKHVRRFRFVGTGHDIDEELLLGRYFGKIYLFSRVWHLFELPINASKDSY